MSVIITIPIYLPLVAFGNPVLFAMLASAAMRDMDFAKRGVAATTEKTTMRSVELDIPNAGEVSAGAGQDLTFERDDVTITFTRDAAGAPKVRVHGSQSRDELRRIGEEAANRLAQQYAYHRLKTEMEAKGMNVVEEDVEEDGTVRMRVRVFRG